MIVKKILGVCACSALLFGVTGCGNDKKEPDYADKRAIETIASGFEKGTDVIGDTNQFDKDYIPKLKAGFKVDLDTIKGLKDEKYKDSNLQENVVGYINCVQKQAELLEKMPSNPSMEQMDEWDQQGGKCAVFLKYFVEKHHLTVKGTAKTTLDDMIKEGQKVDAENKQKEALSNIVSKADWKQTGEFGQYKAVLENNTDYNYKNVSLKVHFIDQEGVKNSTVAFMDSFKKGEKVRVEAVPEPGKYQKIETEVESFELEK